MSLNIHATVVEITRSNLPAITEKDTIPPTIQFTSPERALYIGNKKVIPFLTTIIVGSINIEVQASDYESGIDRVEFYIDNELKKTDNLAPYSWMWKEHTPFRFRHTIKAVAYDMEGNSAVKEVKVWKSFSAGLKNEKITFYFKDVLNFEETKYDSMFGMLALASESHPTKRVDSKYPPSLFKMDNSKILPRYNLNSEELLIWFTNWIFYFMWAEFDDEYKDLFDGLELIFPHPFRIVEAYENDRNEPIEIKGDIVFDLYFSSDIPSKLRNKDYLKIGLYSMNPKSILPSPRLIMNKTVQIKPKLLKDIHNQIITLENVNCTLEPREILLFQIEIIPSNKTIRNIVNNIIDVDRLLDRWGKRADRLENSRIRRLQELGALINLSKNIAEELNITEDDIAEIVNGFRSTSFVYDSVHHPSSVTIPASIINVPTIQMMVDEADDRLSVINTDADAYWDDLALRVTGDVTICINGEVTTSAGTALSAGTYYQISDDMMSSGSAHVLIHGSDFIDIEGTSSDLSGITVTIIHDDTDTILGTYTFASIAQLS